jgi:predicted protein tyrosine phosphatase
MHDDVPMKPVPPFLITICGIEELPGHAERQVSHVLSILDPDRADLEHFGAYGEHARLEIRFDDIIEEVMGQQAPQATHVEQILEFGRSFLAESEGDLHLLVHCHMGVSRSTAAMTLLLAQAQPELPAREVLHQVLTIRDKAWPNLRVLALGEEMLGRPGEFTGAVAEIYAHQISKRPQIEDFFAEVGRGREVELAKAFKKP